MNTYYSFLEKIHPYLRTVRKLKTHVSYDLIFPDRWVLPKNNSKDIEIVKNGNESGNVSLSFVCPIQESAVTQIELLIDNIIKTNKEREDKDKLFRIKVQELKHIFEQQNLEDLKGLKFDVDEIDSILNSNGEEHNEPGPTGGVTLVGEGTKESN